MLDHLRIVYKKSFWNAYDHVGTLVLVNLVWAVCSLPLITLPVSTAGLFYVTSQIAAYREVRVRDFFVGCSRHGWRGVRLCSLYALVLAVFLVNVRFYSQVTGPLQWVGAVVGGGMIWGGIFISLAGVYAFPLLVQTADPIAVIIKKSALLVLDNVRYTSVLLISGIVGLVLGLITGAGVVCGAVATVSLLLNTGLREGLRKYEPPVEAASGGLIGQPATDPEESRGWRDLIRPWE